MSCNLQVRACRSGWVCAARNDSNVGGASRKFALHANYVQILHKDNTVGCYMHFQQNGVTAQVGKAVRRGQVIGFIGMTGFTSRPHIHFHVKRNGNYHEGSEWHTGRQGDSDVPAARMLTHAGVC